MAFGYCMWAINDFVFVWVFFIAHLSGKHYTLFTPGPGAAFDGVAPTLAQSESIQTLEYVTVGFGNRSPLITANAVWPLPGVLPGGGRRSHRSGQRNTTEQRNEALSPKEFSLSRVSGCIMYL